MRTLSLFSGCLGLDQGLESAGAETVAYVEQDAHCLRVIRHRRPDVRVISDVRNIDAVERRRLGEVECVAGGFPCQDLSYAGRGAGLDGDRSGLWFAMKDVVEEVQPRLVLIENVPGLLTRGLGVVLWGLARMGYVGRWFTLGAVDVGAPHRRLRIFVTARKADDGCPVFRLAGGDVVGLMDEAGWVSPQETLLEREVIGKFPKNGRWTLEAVYGDPDTADADESVLLPTPSAQESTPTDEVVEQGVDPERRLYLPGRKWHVQRTLSRVVPATMAGALLPTPGASDGTGAEGETRRARQEEGSTGGPSLRDLPHLLEGQDVKDLIPTPSASDAKGPSPNHAGTTAEAVRDLPPAVEDEDDVKLLPTPTAGDGKASGSRNLEGSNAHPGVSLTDAVQTGGSTTPRRLLPTPTSQAAKHGELTPSEREQLETEGDNGNLWLAAGKMHDEGKLLPTPTAEEGRQSKDSTHKGGNPTLASVGQLLPTPTAEDGERGRHGAGSDRLGAATFDEPLLPTPTSRDHHAQGAGANPGASPQQLSTLVQKHGLDEPLLPTPTATYPGGSEEDFLERKGRQEGGAVHLNHAVEPLLPTPDASANRKSPRAMTSSGTGEGNGRRSGGGQSSPPGLGQVAELAAGHVPDDMPPYDDLPPETRRVIDGFGHEGKLLPTPVANPDNPGAGGELRAAVVHGEGRRNETGVDTMGRPNTGRPSGKVPNDGLLPTPTAQDSTGRTHHAKGGNPSLLGAARNPQNPTEKLLPTPKSNPTGGPPVERNEETLRTGRRPSGQPATFSLATVVEEVIPEKLLPTPTAEDSTGRLRQTRGDGTANESDAADRSGTHTLTDVGRVVSGQAESKLLPTPASADDGYTSRGGDRKDELLLGGIAKGASEGKLLPTPTSQLQHDSQTHRSGERGDELLLGGIAKQAGEGKLLPTPTMSGSGNRDSKENRHLGHGPTLNDAAAEIGKLLPTPQAADGHGGRLEKGAWEDGTGRRPSGTYATKPLATAIWLEQRGQEEPEAEDAAPDVAEAVEAGDLDAPEHGVKWGVYEPAIRRWENLFGQPAPPPTDEKGRLSPDFVAWMMGFQPGWVDIPGVSRTAKLRMLGNAVQVQVGYVAGLALLDLDAELATQ